MNSSVSKRRDFIERYANAIQILVLAGIFLYYFVENFILSESWDVLSLRSIDDYAMNDAMHQMQKALTTGHWVRALTFFDYAYGNIFWLLNAVLLLPVYGFGSAQFHIVAGRQLSLLYVSGSIYLIGLIVDRVRPDARPLKYPILVAVATMPMLGIIATKLHVNAQCIFFGILAFYMLVRSPVLTRRDATWSGLFVGVSVGLKLTGIFVLPLLMLQIWVRTNENSSSRRTYFWVFVRAFLPAAAFCVAPLLLLAPFYVPELKSTWGTFKEFKKLGTGDGYSGVQASIFGGLGYFVSPPALFALLILYVAIVRDEVKRRRYQVTYIAGVMVMLLVYLAVTVHKAPLYIATYFLNLGFFIPMGYVGLAKLPASDSVKVVVAYVIIIAALIYGAENRKNILYDFNFYEVAQSERIHEHLRALEGMRRLVAPLKLPVRILQDVPSAFPGTKFTEGVTVTYNYGNLHDYSNEKLGQYDFILLNEDGYFGAVSDAEKLVRNELIKNGTFFGFKYKLIYRSHNAILFKLVKN